jgi:hypothetical protein
MSPAQRCVDAIEKIVGRAAKREAAGIPGVEADSVYRTFMLAVGAFALCVGLDGEEGEYAIIEDSTRLDVVNQSLESNSIGYRLVELQRPRGMIQ